MAEKNPRKGKITEKSLSAYYNSLVSTYGFLPASGVYGAFSRTSFGSAMTDNPYIQNRRIKGISSSAYPFNKDKVASFLKKPEDNEQPLRETMEWARYAAYPIFNIIKTYQDVPTYRFYNYPLYAEESEAKSEEFKREWRLLEKICQKIKPKQSAHMIMGQCGVMGKVHYYLRTKIDKSHNSCEYAYLQQLPSDWTKIIGFNNVSKYTLSFNLMYFMTPGTDIRQFGPLFTSMFDEMMNFIPRKYGKVVYNEFDIKKFSEESQRRPIKGNPEVYEQNGTWFYWVSLPPTECWTFEIDDVTRNVFSPFVGLLINAIQQADYEQVQLAILQNPLIACALAEMETIDTAIANQADPIKISPATREAYSVLWNDLMLQNNTSGIGMYAAPFKNMHLESLAEAPNAADISGKGYSYLIQKSGIGIISATDEPRVGMVQIAAKLAAQFARTVYGQFENMMTYLYSTLGLKYDWAFKMFGDIFSEEDDLKAAKDGMTLGILIDTLRNDAIRGHSILDDISISNAVLGSKLMEKRTPLISTYSAKAGEGNLPPVDGKLKNPDGTDPTKENPQGGRPDEGEAKSEGAEDDVDSYGK